MQSLSLISSSSTLRLLTPPSPPLPSGYNRRFLALSTGIRLRPRRLVTLCSQNLPESSPARRSPADYSDSSKLGLDDRQSGWSFQVGSPAVLPSRSLAKLSLSDQAFFLLAFIACTTSVAFTSLVVAAVPTLYALGRAANSLAKLADTAREELPSTMAAVRLSGMEISDLTLELSGLSQEISEGVTKSAEAVQAGEAGIRQIGTLAHQQTVAIIQERASLPIISIQPVVVGAAKKTSHAVGQATKSLMNMISGGEVKPEDEDKNNIDRVDL